MTDNEIRDIPLDDLLVHFSNFELSDSFNKRYHDDPVLREVTAGGGYWLSVRDKATWDQEAVQRYMEVLDSLPPIVVYDIGDYLMVSDGVHRYHAARHLGRETILAEVRRGTLADALEYGAIANLKHGLPLTLHERNRSMARLYRLRPTWTMKVIGKEYGISEGAVSKAIKAVEMEVALERAQGPTRILGKHPYPQEDLTIVTKLENLDQAQHLLEAKRTLRWDRATLREKVVELCDPALTDDDRQEHIGELPTEHDQLREDAWAMNKWVLVSGTWPAARLLRQRGRRPAEIAELLVHDSPDAARAWLDGVEATLRNLGEDIPYVEAVTKAVREQLGGPDS